MSGLRARITILILVLVVGIAAWSKMRHMDKEVYESPARWSTSEHPAFNKTK